MTKDEFIRWAKSRGYKDTGQGVKFMRLVKGNSSFKVDDTTAKMERRIPDKPEKWTTVIMGPLTELNLDSSGMLTGFDEIAKKRRKVQ